MVADAAITGPMPRHGIPTALERLASMVARLARETSEEAWMSDPHGAFWRLRAVADDADALVAELSAPPSRENGA